MIESTFFVKFDITYYTTRYSEHWITHARYEKMTDGYDKDGNRSKHLMGHVNQL